MYLRAFLNQYRYPRAFLLSLLLLAPVPIFAQSNQVVYTDSLQNNWQNWSWATVNPNNTSVSHSGASSISVSSTNWQALYLHHAAQGASPFGSLTFWINGGSGGQAVHVQATLSGNSQTAVELSPLPVNSWRQETIPLSSLGVAGASDFDGFWLQVENSGLAPTLYMDDISLLAATNVIAAATSGPVNITIDASLARHPINPLIYSVAYAASNDLKQLNVLLNRQGGNPTSRYNWQANADNRASDYYFASLGYNSATPGEHGDSFIVESRAGGAEPSLTIPMLDWVAKLGASRARTWSYSIVKYGQQKANDSVDGWPDMGNGLRPDDTLITTNDPSDANVPAGPAFQQGWLDHLTSTWGHATNGGLRYYHLDNEPGIWHSTHQDVHPIGVTMDELLNKMTNYAAHIKATDPGALVLGPEEWHYYAAIYSGFDSQYEGDHNFPGIYPDRTAHNGINVYPFLLQSLAGAATNFNHRLLDVCTIHYYPQGGEFGNDTSTATQLLRNRSTRSLWDSNYVDETWLAGNSLTRIIKLIPQLHQWVATNYPGTLIGITEYNWGAENHINGATAQADVLGIFGREGLDLAERWTIPPTNSPTFKAMQLYRNYDFNKSTFGETSVSATVPNPDAVSAFAALRSTDGALTIIAINKQIGSNAPVTLTLTNFPATGTAQVWQLTAANTINHLPDLTLTGNILSNTLPAQSITLFIIPIASTPNVRFDSLKPNNAFNFWLDGQSGLRYAVLTSSNLFNWSVLQTNTLTSNSALISIIATNPLRFYRAQRLP